jgi:ketosteroid isomerase-like protein
MTVSAKGAARFGALNKTEARMDALTTARHFYLALASGDVGGALALLNADIEWTEAERSPYYAGTLRGPNAVVAGVLAPINGDFEGFAATPAEFVADGERVAVFGTYTGLAKITGIRLSVPFVHLWTVADGRLRRFIQYTDSTLWREALGG